MAPIVPVTDQATLCATLADEWVRCGVTDVVLAPGSRSSPLAVALAVTPGLRVHVHHDERAAAFIALGLGLATRRPAVVLTTSGTAATEIHAAVVEAHQAHVPLIACTADRPPELHHVGAPQTIDQVHLFGRAVRWYAEPGVADDAGRGTWRSLAARAYIAATGRLPGPVHLNLAFRDPLVGAPGPLPEGRRDGRPWHKAAGVRADLADRDLLNLVGRLAGARGVILAGAGAGDPSSVHALARVVGWPVLADPRSDCRLPRPTTVAYADALLRQAVFARDHRPDVVLRLGASPASRAVARWLAGLDSFQVAVAPEGVWWDADRTADLVVAADPTALNRQLTRALGDHGASPDWLAGWSEADEVADAAIAKALAARGDLNEPAVARDLVASVPDGTTLMVSSSMPVRDVEWYSAPRAGIRTVANRGANGIDGVVSTAVGLALSGRGPTVALVGDIAFLHDSTALLGAADREVNLTVVVVDNRGGGIFSFLPQAAVLAPERFELVMGTPHSVQIEDMVAVHGLASVTVDDPSGLTPAVRAAVEGGGVSVVVVRTDRAVNVAVHDELNAAVATALAG